MKASVKLRRDPQGRVQKKKPIVKLKLPFELLGFPVQAGLTVCGHIQELALRLCLHGAHQESGPSLQLSFRPQEQDRPFIVSLKTGFSPWPSSPASSLTMAAEFNLSRPSNPTFLLRVTPQVGDFSLRHDFRSEFGRSNGSVMGDHGSPSKPQPSDSTPSEIGFTNAFARYAPPVSHFAENASFSWHDPVKSGSDRGGLHHQYDGTCNADFASYDSTPHASESAGFPRFDRSQCSVEHPRTVSQVFKNEKTFQNGYHGWITDMDWGPLNGRSNSYSQKAHRIEDGWERIGDATSRSTTTSASSSLPQRRDVKHKQRVCRHSESYSTSSVGGWGARGWLEESQVRACTRLPISSEAHIKIRWSVGACCLSSSAPLVPILLLDKVSLEANAQCAGADTVTPTMVLSKVLQRSEAQTDLHDEDMQMESGMGKKVREDRRSDDRSDYTVSGSKSIPTMNVVHADSTAGNKKNNNKNSFLGQFLQWKGP